MEKLKVEELRTISEGLQECLVVEISHGAELTAYERILEYAKRLQNEDGEST